MPITSDKVEGPTTVIEFLGLTIDSNLMVVHVPQDKLHDISAILTKMIHSRKATSWELQSLAGKLNFITKAVPAGRSFTNRIYQAFRGIPNHRHIDLQSAVLSDLRMWKVFLQCFRGWAPIIHHKQLHLQAVELFADAAGNQNLGWGAWLPHKGYWMYGAWEQQFFEQFNPSIDFLELYAVLAAVITWAPTLVDKAVIFRSDNTPTVFALKN